MRILVVAVICAVVARGTVDGQVSNTSPPPPIQPSGAHAPFHYTCESTGNATYDFLIHFNTTSSQKYVVTGKKQNIDLLNKSNTCLKNITAGINVALTGCLEEKVYLLKLQDVSPSPGTSSVEILGGSNFEVYEISCLVRQEGAKYSVNNTVQVKDSKESKNEKENPDLNLVMTISYTNDSQKPVYEIGEVLKLDVKDKTKDKNNLTFEKCVAKDNSDPHVMVDLISNGTTTTQEIVIGGENKTNIGEVFVTFHSFRFVKSNTVDIICTIRVLPNKAAGRRRRSVETGKDHRQSSSVLDKLTKYFSRSKRAADAFDRNQPKKTLTASFTIKDIETDKGLTETSKGNDVSASTFMMALLVMSAVATRTWL